MSVATPHLSSEHIREDSRYLHLLQQLGDHAVREMMDGNPVFQQHFSGTLAPNTREIIKEQADVLNARIGKLAATAAEEAEAANSQRLGTVLRQLAQQQELIAGCAGNHGNHDNHGNSAGEFEFVHPATQRFLKILDELRARNNYIEIAGALYTLFKMAAAEKILHPDENAPQQIRKATHSQVRVAGLVASEAGLLAGDNGQVPEDASLIPEDDDPWEREISPSNDGPAVAAWEDATGGASAPGIGPATTGFAGAEFAGAEFAGAEFAADTAAEDLAQALQDYASAYYPLRECIMPGMDAVIEAKKKFYRELASDFYGELAADGNEDARPPLKVSSLF